MCQGVRSANPKQSKPCAAYAQKHLCKLDILQTRFVWVEPLAYRMCVHVQGFNLFLNLAQRSFGINLINKVEFKGSRQPAQSVQSFLQTALDGTATTLKNHVQKYSQSLDKAPKLALAELAQVA